METVRIKTGETETVEAQAYIVGPFAVHRTLWGDNKWYGKWGKQTWSVTHVKSGLAAAKQVPKLNKARALARDLINVQGIDWSLERPDKGLSDNTISTLRTMIHAAERE